ncbi:MAG: hypothetical protein QG660_1667, partial [Pseudomonadota bacterium]|nr:hypothetical protein [Pseudomonadota bacterium]
SEINLAIWRSFRANGIGFPYPQREVRILNPVNSGNSLNSAGQVTSLQP